MGQLIYLNDPLVSKKFRCRCCLTCFSIDLDWEGKVVGWKGKKGNTGTRVCATMVVSSHVQLYRSNRP